MITIKILSSEIMKVMMILQLIDGILFKFFSFFQMEDFLRQTYRDVSIHIVFVQQALGEQIAVDDRVLKNELSGLKQKLFELLCKVHHLAISRNITISSFVDASVMPSSMKNISDDTRRYKRNYVLGKDTQIFLGNLEANFTTLYSEVQG